jgi:hypothetical protein
MSLSLDPDAPHAFNFVIGNWRVHHRRLMARLTGCTEWDTFDGLSSTNGKNTDMESGNKSMRCFLIIFLLLSTLSPGAFASVSSIFNGDSLYSRANEVVLIKDSNVDAVETSDGWTVTFSPSSVWVFKGDKLPASFSVSGPPQTIYAPRADKNSKGAFYALLLLYHSTNDPTSSFRFAGSDPEQILVELPVDDKLGKATTYQELLATMLSSNDHYTRIQGLYLCGGV